MSEIAIVIEGLGSGGAQRVATTLANHWGLDGRPITMITLTDSGADFFSLAQAVQRRVIGGTEVSGNILAGMVANTRRLFSLRKILRDLRPRVLIGFGTTINILVILASLGLGIRVVISERNDPSRQSIGIIWDTLRRACYRFAEAVTANTHAALKAMEGYVPAHKLHYLPNPLPPSPDRPLVPGPVVLSVGRLHLQKAHDVLIAAFSKISAKYPGWSLVILGEGELRTSLESQAADLHMGDRICFPGQTADPYQYYLKAGIFVLASRYEGTSNALLEAMNCGLPVIVSDACPGSINMVKDGVSGLVVRTGDADALANALSRLMERDDLRVSMGAAGQDRISGLRNEDALGVWDNILLSGAPLKYDK